MMRKLIIKFWEGLEILGRLGGFIEVF